MTTSSHIGSASRSREAALVEVALGVFLVIVVAALWFAFFSFVPFELRPPRVS